MCRNPSTLSCSDQPVKKSYPEATTTDWRRSPQLPSCTGWATCVFFDLMAPENQTYNAAMHGGVLLIENLLLFGLQFVQLGL
jgi:hypothetical protein